MTTEAEVDIRQTWRICGAPIETLRLGRISCESLWLRIDGDRAVCAHCGADRGALADLERGRKRAPQGLRGPGGDHITV